MEKTVTKIIPDKVDTRIRVVVYCRVSSNKETQLNSLSNQLEYLIDSVNQNPKYELVNVYIDIKSGSAGTSRRDLQRMMCDARNHKFDLILMKSCSRFFRNVTEALTVLHELADLGINVRFDDEGKSSMDNNFWLEVTMTGVAAEHYNKVRSDSIKWGLHSAAKDGTSRLYDRKCFGYTHDNEGHLIVIPEQAAVVQLIFELYLSGYSIVKIIRELHDRGIPSPTRKETWYKRSIETMLTNVKYVGSSVVMQSSTIGYEKKKRVKSETIYRIDDDHEAIISKEDFAAVQIQRLQRSNVTVDKNGKSQRSNTRYSSK